MVIKKESMGEEMETVGTWTIPYYGTTKTFQVDELTLPDTSYGVSKKGWSWIYKALPECRYGTLEIELQYEMTTVRPKVETKLR